jgi:hypothetical protein
LREIKILTRYVGSQEEMGVFMPITTESLALQGGDGDL